MEMDSLVSPSVLVEEVVTEELSGSLSCQIISALETAPSSQLFHLLSHRQNRHGHQANPPRNHPSYQIHNLLRNLPRNQPYYQIRNLPPNPPLDLLNQLVSPHQLQVPLHHNLLVYLLISPLRPLLLSPHANHPLLQRSLHPNPRALLLALLQIHLLNHHSYQPTRLDSHPPYRQ